jgi:hypothetical protein
VGRKRERWNEGGVKGKKRLRIEFWYFCQSKLASRIMFPATRRLMAIGRCLLDERRT